MTHFVAVQGDAQALDGIFGRRILAEQKRIHLRVPFLFFALLAVSVR